MSDDPKLASGEWQMPDPVFRSSEGRTPKSAKNYLDPDDVDTAAPDFSEADTDEIITDDEPVNQDEIDTETPEFGPEGGGAGGDTGSIPPDTLPSVPQKQAGGCAQTVGLMAGVIAFSIIAIIVAAIYFLLYYRPTDTTF